LSHAAACAYHHASTQALVQIDANYIDIDTLRWTFVTGKGQNNFVMDKNSLAPAHAWVVWLKAFTAASKYLYAGLAETVLADIDFRILEALLNKGPLPVNTIGPKVNLTPGSISVAVDRLFAKGLVSRTENPNDRRIRVVSLTPKGKEVIAPVFRKHAVEIGKLFAGTSPKELRTLEKILKRVGKRAESLRAKNS
jgi:MarR family transcriptional regulator, 2-MHQ and catechol-resistance regulon repressor